MGGFSWLLPPVWGAINKNGRRKSEKEIDSNCLDFHAYALLFGVGN